MSELAKKARAAMKAKAKSFGASPSPSSTTDPHTKVDSSSWTPPEPLNADVKTGMRPVSRRAFKTGGKVEGKKTKAHMGKAPRANGGKALSADSFINRNTKEANESRPGVKHVGGMKKGGRAHKDFGGLISDSIDRLRANVGLPPDIKEGRPTNEESKEHYQALREGRPSEMDRRKLNALFQSVSADNRSRQEAQRKHGGRTKKEIGGPLAGAQKMLDRSVQQAGVPSATMSFARSQRGSLSPMRATGMKKGGSAHEDVAEDKALIRKMVKPSARTGKDSGGGVFSGPGYPGKVPGVTGGRIARATGGKTKGKTDINIVIAAGGKPSSDMPAPPMGAMGSSRPVPVPPPAANAAPMPMPMGMPPAPPQGAGPAPAMPPMPRKSGGRITKVAKSYKDMEAGAGSGEGRLQKTDIAKRTMHNKGGKVGHRNYRNYKDMDAGAGSGFGRLEKTEIAKKGTGIQMA